jgi:hypothetical protein
MSESTKKPVSDRRAVANARSIRRNTTDAKHHEALCWFWLEAFIDHINAQRGKLIDDTLADALIADAQESIQAAT